MPSVAAVDDRGDHARRFGRGSLRSAMEASGPRFCVFRVSGTITLKSAIQVRTPYLTVAGQTSPGGVEIRGDEEPDGDWGVWFINGAHDIVLRHLRVRMGGNLKFRACPDPSIRGIRDGGARRCRRTGGRPVPGRGRGLGGPARPERRSGDRPAAPRVSRGWRGIVAGLVADDEDRRIATFTALIPLLPETIRREPGFDPRLPAGSQPEAATRLRDALDGAAPD